MNDMAPLTDVPLRVKLRVEDYLALDEAGAFAAYGRTELLDGDIFYMNAQHRPHGVAKLAMYDALRDAVRAAKLDLTVLVEVSVALSAVDTPEPDLCLTSEPVGPGPIPLRSVRLIVEVADTTLALDMGVKRRLYARAGVPEYWVADVEARSITQFWQVSDDGYEARRELAFGASITAGSMERLVVDTSLF